MAEFLLTLLGYLLIWVAVDVNRKPESKIEMFSLKWFLVLILIFTGTLLIAKFAYK